MEACCCIYTSARTKLQRIDRSTMVVQLRSWCFSQTFYTFMPRLSVLLPTRTNADNRVHSAPCPAVACVYSARSGRVQAGHVWGFSRAGLVASHVLHLAPCVPCVSCYAGRAAATQLTYAANSGPCPALLRAISARSGRRDGQAGLASRPSCSAPARGQDVFQRSDGHGNAALPKEQLGTGQIYGYTGKARGLV